MAIGGLVFCILFVPVDIWGLGFGVMQFLCSYCYRGFRVLHSLCPYCYRGSRVQSLGLRV